MNPIAENLNKSIKTVNPYIFDMLSNMGKQLFSPKGILSQGAEAKQKAHHINATIGIACENGETMLLSSIAGCISGIDPKTTMTYAPSPGKPEIRQAWQKELLSKNHPLTPVP